MTPEEQARINIDKQLNRAGWEIVSRNDFVPINASAVREALMEGNTESDYLLCIDGNAIAVIEAKREENPLGDDVERQAEEYALHPQSWYGLWTPDLIPLVYLANGSKILFKNLLHPEIDYAPLSEMDSPKDMLKKIGRTSQFGALPLLNKGTLRDCQYEAELEFERSLKQGKKKSLAVLATGSGKTFFACLASYRLLNYTPVKRVLFLVDRNNLARQAQTEYQKFKLTENNIDLGSLYDIKRLQTVQDAKRAPVVISTIQKLYAVLTGSPLIGTDSEDAEDEKNMADEEKETAAPVQLNGDLTLPPDHFQLIVVDECHRSIYGQWRAVLDYFSGACVLGLTATPTPEAYAFFNNNIVKNYTYEQSVLDGVNVPAQIYRIKTSVTEHGGAIQSGDEVTEIARKTGEKEDYSVPDRIDYQPDQIDRSVVNPSQIETVLREFKRIVYTQLYPNRERKWEYVPKTLIFAKDENHAQRIVDAVKEIFKKEFESGEVPEHFVQKITYTAADSNGLIRDLNTEKDFRIAVTVTLVATGTDVKPLEIVLFMKDVQSDVLYTQMKGRGCRVISDDKLREVTPNADSKNCYYIIDAVGVTEHDHTIPSPGGGSDGVTIFTLEKLLEHLAHKDLTDDNLCLLRDKCSRIHNRYEGNSLHGRHLDYFIETFGFSPKDIAQRIQNAVDNSTLPPFVSPSEDNSARMSLIADLINSLPARKKLIEMNYGYQTITSAIPPDEVIYSGFSKESAKTFIENFEAYLNDNKDAIEALRIIYNSEDAVITNSMLVDLQDNLRAENRQYEPEFIWSAYKTIDANGAVDELDRSENAKALTDLIQIVRFAYKINPQLSSLIKGYAKRFNLYCGQLQRQLTDDQKEVMRQIAEYIVREGAISAADLNEINADLWRQGVSKLTPAVLAEEMLALANILLKA